MLQEDKKFNEVLFLPSFIISRGVFKDWSFIPSVLPQSIAQARRQGPAPLAEHHLHGNHYHGNGIGREVGGLAPRDLHGAVLQHQPQHAGSDADTTRRGPGSTGEMLVTLFKNTLCNLKSLNANTDKRQFQSF